MFKQAVDRSQGRLVDLTIAGFLNDELLQYVADRSSQLKRLEIVHSCGEMWSECVKKLSLLEELIFLGVGILPQDIEVIGHYCPLLKTLVVNKKESGFRYIGDDDVAVAIGKNLPNLTHLELVGNNMTNIGLQAILDGCCHLESLDLRGCLHVDLKGDLGKRCVGNFSVING